MILCISRLEMENQIFFFHGLQPYETWESRSEHGRGGTKENEVNGCMG